MVEGTGIPPHDTATPKAKTVPLTGQSATDHLQNMGEHPSLVAAFRAARYAFEKLDPTAAHARGADYFAANSAQQLRAWFGPGGVEFASGRAAREGSEPWSLQVRLSIAGRTDAPVDVAQRSIRAAGSRVEISDRTGVFTEWYENKPEGIEQGFTLSHPPPGAGKLKLVLGVTGKVRPAPDGARLMAADGMEVLTVTGLKAWDAAGRELDARMEARDMELALLVDDAGAHYPITIDPLFANPEARLITDNASAGDRFGSSVALSGETAVIGASEDDGSAGSSTGSAYVFVRSGTKWDLQAKLTANDAAALESFGWSVALAGDTAVVGATQQYSTGAVKTGRAYVFVRSGTSWSQQALLTANDGANDDIFGFSVALSGNTALVGAKFDDTAAGQNAGGAYVFVRNGNSWSQEAKLAAGDAAHSDQFGFAVALSSDTAVVGAHGHDTAAGTDAGSAYVFVRAGGVWSQQSHLKASDGASGDSFGQAVAVEGDTVLVGAPRNNTGQPLSGGVYVFSRSGGAWTQQAKLAAAGVSDQFGSAVALSGNTALVGSHGDDRSPNTNIGSAYVFVRSGSSWSQQIKLVAGDGAGNDLFGNAVALAGDTALVGSHQDDTTTGLDAGSAHVFVRSGTTWSTQEQLTASDSTAFSRLGVAVAFEGNTAVIGAELDDTAAGVDTGSVYVLVRSGVTWKPQGRLFAEDGSFRDYFGRSLALSGDTIVVGVEGDDTAGREDSGSVYVFVRNAERWTQQAKVVSTEPEIIDNFGHAVALAGDTALVGAYRRSTPSGIGSGRVYVFVRTGTTWLLQAPLNAAGLAPTQQFGCSLALAGETALIGSRYDDVGSVVDGGSAYVFVRSGSTWSQQARLTAAAPRTSALFGNSVALAGDTAVVGAPGAQYDQGRAYVFVRGGSVWEQQAELAAIDTGGEDEFGWAVSAEGDVVVVGAFRDDTTAGATAGSAHVFARNGSIWSHQTKLTAGFDGSNSDQFGISVALGGDTVLIGAPFDDTNGQDAGTVYAFRLGEMPVITDHPDSRTVVPGQMVEFAIEANGTGPLSYQWRKDGHLLPNARGASHSIASVQATDEGQYDCVVSNVGGTVVSAPATLVVNGLSQFARQVPAAPPESEGFITVNLTPSGILHGWRFVGEQQWRPSGLPVAGLTTSDREIEFRPVPGFVQPQPEPVSMVSGEAATYSYEYISGGSTGSGGVTVTLKPATLATAQWRLLGETDADWRNSDVTLPGKPPGNYLIECKPVAGRATPANVNVAITHGQTATVTITYFLPGATTGAPPAVLSFESVTTDTTRPYAHVGQLRSAVGSSTGFVVKDRVVATAAHVVWDDGTLAAVQGLQWLFQRYRGVHEPVALLPRGHYTFDGYAAQRIADNSPGDSSPQSQHLDVAAIYFNTSAGRGGYGGFLASDFAQNEFLLSNANKMLMGYPTDGISASSQGRMHATEPFNVVFTAGFGRTFTTSGIRSSGGNSGGPLCVQFEGGAYYPAAIYLGGDNQTIVRAIDSEVIELFNRAETSANGGGNNTGGGITHTSVSGTTSSTTGSVQVIIEPEAARNAGAGWRLGDSGSHRVSGAVRSSITPGGYTLHLLTVPGFDAPASQPVNVSGGQLSSIIYTYALAPVLTAQELWRQTYFGSTPNSGNASDAFDYDGDGFTNAQEYAAGTNPTLSGDFFKAENPQRSGNTFSVSTPGRTGRTYTLERSATMSGWTPLATQGPLASDGVVTLSDPAAGGGPFFYRIRATGP